MKLENDTLKTKAYNLYFPLNIKRHISSRIPFKIGNILLLLKTNNVANKKKANIKEIITEHSNSVLFFSVKSGFICELLMIVALFRYIFVLFIL